MKRIAGPEKKSRVVTPQAKRLTAYHEAGHAVVIHELDSQDPVHQITIIPEVPLRRHDHFPCPRRTAPPVPPGAGGAHCGVPGRPGGKQLVLGDVSTGASSDIQKASSIARSMVTKFGMSDKLGAIAYGNESDEVFIGRTMAQARSYSEVAGLIDGEVKAIVDQAYSRCEEISSPGAGRSWSSPPSTC